MPRPELIQATLVPKMVTTKNARCTNAPKLDKIGHNRPEKLFPSAMQFLIPKCIDLGSPKEFCN